MKQSSKKKEWEGLGQINYVTFYLELYVIYNYLSVWLIFFYWNQMIFSRVKHFTITFLITTFHYKFLEEIIDENFNFRIICNKIEQ